MIWSFIVGGIAALAIVMGLVRLYRLEQQEKQQALNDAGSQRLAALREGHR